MDIPVLVEPVEGGRYRAQAPFSMVAEGATAAEAIQQLTELIRQRLQRGACLTSIALTASTPAAAGTLPFPADNLHEKDWVFREMQQAIEENRRKENAAGL
jgi:hypothetical protein